MIGTLENPTAERELALSAPARRKEFHRGIDAKAAALRAKEIDAATAAAEAERLAAATWESEAPAWPVTPPLSEREFFKECWFLIEGVSPKRPSLGEIKRAVCSHYRLPEEAMIVGRRRVDWLRPRQLAMYLCNTMTTKSMPEIGRAFGGADHTTVLHAGRRLPVLMAKDPTFAAVVAKIRTQLEEAL